MSQVFPLLDRYRRNVSRAIDEDPGEQGDLNLLAQAYDSHQISVESFLVGTEIVLQVHNRLSPPKLPLLQTILLALLRAEETGRIGFALSKENVENFSRWVATFNSKHASTIYEILTPDTILALNSDDSTQAFIGIGDSASEVVLNHNSIYFHKHFVSDVLIEKELQSRINNESYGGISEHELPSLVSQLENDLSSKLTEEQRKALMGACLGKLSWISGGPGTGKTFLVFYLIKLFLRLGCQPDKIKLVAPTGKSVERINKSLAKHGKSDVTSLPKTSPSILIQAETLHRTLGYRKNSPYPKHNRDHTLEADVLIVDEATMIDHSTFADLLIALPKSTHLVFIGDKNQLPSIGPGGLFKNQFTHDSKGHHTILQTNFRMQPSNPNGADILNFADSILNDASNIDSFALDSLSDKENGVRWIDPLHLSLEDIFRDELKRSNPIERSAYTQTMEWDGNSFLDKDINFLNDLFHARRQFKILSPTNNGPLGTHALNEWIKQHLAPKSMDMFYPGCQVIVTENNYELSLWNGTEGIAMLVSRQGRPPKIEFVFEDKDQFTCVEQVRLGDQVSPAHAITIHKSQGSEFTRVVALFPPQRVPQVQKELVYTSCTRASTSLTLVARKEDFASYLP